MLLPMPRPLTLTLTLTLTLLALTACGSDPEGDDTPALDAATASPDADLSRCTVVPDLGDLGALAGTGTASGAAGTRQVNVSVTVAQDTSTRDVVYVQLKGGRGTFAAGAPAPGTYPITGVDAAYGTCGVCVTLIGDLVPGQGPTQFYFATGGTVTVSAVTGRLTGSVSGVTFGELDLTSEELVAGGCTSRLGGLAFDAALP